VTTAQTEYVRIADAVRITTLTSWIARKRMRIGGNSLRFLLTLSQIGVLLARKENVVLNAEFKTIQPVFCAMVDIDGSKVARIINAIEAGQELPPVVVVDLGDTFMPLDGHHRLQAHASLGLPVLAWVIDEEAFEDLDIHCRDNDLGRAEDNILCGDRHVFEVAA